MRNYKNGNKNKNRKPVTGDKGTQSNAFFHSREVESSKSEPKSSDYNHHGDEKSFNDPEWYVNSEQILKDAARIPYSLPVGTCYIRDGKLANLDPELIQHSYDNAMPGIMVSYLMPTLGATSQESSAALNVAANSLFQFIRSKISGTRKYESVDTMIYLGSMDSIFTNITWFTRLYATCYTYHQANKYLAQALVEAQNVDFDSLSNNLPNFRTALNIEIAKIRSMFLPNVMPIFKRHSWMFSHYFIEGDSEKDQIYCHAPAGYYIFGLDDSGKGKLNAYRFAPAHKYTWTELIQILRAQIDAIFRREDFNTISGDMLKAYEGNVFSLTEIPDIATVTLTHSVEVLLQFKNGKYKNLLPVADDNTLWLGSFFDYIQNSNGDLIMLGCTSTWGTASIQSFSILDSSNDNSWTPVDSTGKAILSRTVMNEWTKDTLLTTPSHDVEPVENMINTRLTLGLDFVADSTAPNGVKYNEAYFGSEWPVYYRVFSYHRDKATHAITLFSRTYDRVLVISRGYHNIWVSSQEPIRSAFKYLPEISIIDNESTSSDNVVIYEPGRSIFEVDNYALVSASTIGGLHSAAILGEYNIPNLSIGK